MPYLRIAQVIFREVSQRDKNSPNHRRSLKTDTPSMYVHVLGDSHGFQHFRAEHTAVTDLYPL